jgi:hypothetical protein
MQLAIYWNPFNANARLSELGLDEGTLRAAVGRGFLARNECTENHPRMFPGVVTWAETVAALREQLLPRGWGRSDDNNFSRVVRGDGAVCIIVATGNEATGLLNESPSTKAAKGRNTVEAIAINNAQFELFEDSAVLQRSLDTDGDADGMVTWVLLIHRDVAEMRYELALPSKIDPDGRINQWKERIILRPIPFGEASGSQGDDDALDVDVPIRRRQ